MKSFDSRLPEMTTVSSFLTFSFLQTSLASWRVLGSM